MLYAKRDIYADVDGVRAQIGFEGLPIAEHVRHLVAEEDTTTEVPKADSGEASAAPAEVPVEEASQAKADYSGLTKAQLEEKLTDRRIEFSKEDKKAELIALLEKADSGEASAAPAEVPVEEASQAKADYSGLTKAQLEEKLTDRRIEFSKEDKKAELIALLEKADSGEASAE